ncbi:MAG: hypothetical protein KAR05_10910 [Candidatus Omnitrophica bacterium]|nr:hypothetical protein [Candidatus Omnitrophota bacterium]
MISHVIKKDHKDLLRIAKSMKPEERLVAFYHHSRLIYNLYAAGRDYRGRPSDSSTS